MEQKVLRNIKQVLYRNKWPNLKVIDNAIKSDFKNLSKADKKKLKSFLSDYAASVGQEKNAASTRGKAPSKKRKGIKKYKAGSIK